MTKILMVSACAFVAGAVVALGVVNITTPRVSMTMALTKMTDCEFKAEARDSIMCIYAAKLQVNNLTLNAPLDDRKAYDKGMAEYADLKAKLERFKPHFQDNMAVYDAGYVVEDKLETFKRDLDDRLDYMNTPPRQRTWG